MMNKPKVLIVDDDHGMRHSLKALLGNNGCLLETSDSGRKAIQLMNAGFFDLVLLDLFMPDMNGFQIMDFIKERTPETYVVIITGNSSEKATIEAIRKGAFDYIKKPFEPEKMIKTVENVLDQRRLINERNQATEALKESEQRMKAILQASPVGIGLMIDRKIGWGNDTVYRMLGYEKDALLGQSPRILYPDDGEYERVGKKLYANPGPLGAAQVESRIVRKDQTLCDCMLSSCPLDATDASKGHIVAVSDISEFKRLEAQLQRSQKMEAIGTLAGGVAHDLNNILSGLVSYPELLLMKIPENHPLRKPLLTIQKSGERASTIVQDLLTLARRGVTINEVVNLNGLIANYLKSLEYQHLLSFHPEIELKTNFAADIMNIQGSETHLSKTVMNLTANAAEALKKGGRIMITTENRRITEPIKGYEDVLQGYYVVLKVSDNGVGICSEDIKNIFEPFYTKKKMGKSGTGLGMAIVWSTVKDHNGYIDVQSVEGKGTTFTLYFPATFENVEDDQTGLSALKNSGNGESILIVDDQEDQRNIGSAMLTQLGYSVTAVPSGEAAVEYLKTHKVDLLLLDMIMEPGMDGLDTYKKILEINPQQKAIIGSGFSETDRVRELQRLGASDYVRKPFLVKTLATAVRNAFET